ncbi:MAG: DUF488 domain-containing protein [Chloroflexus sp.]|uniref:DUF488 domain-containing protein n=2 Tax=Chloroflexus sp. TaxID=1904827 RepID=UPI004048F3FD
MLYRQKVLLALIDVFGGAIDRLYLQKMLFLLSLRQKKPVYEFVPYHYGSFSFTAQWDINALSRKGFLAGDKYTVTLVQSDQQLLHRVTDRDMRSLHELCRQYRYTSRTDLLRELYEQYPYYAQRSKLFDEVLDDEAKQRIKQCQNEESGIVLFTIGYEGRSLENYLNMLIRNGIKILVDVRNNPMSMKPGFSKSQLQTYCESLGIGYIHIPEVGIVSELRKNLKSQEDYEELFAAYRREILPTTVSFQQRILNILLRYHRIALTCFEAESQRCHRSHLADAISKLPEFSYEVVHL